MMSDIYKVTKLTNPTPVQMDQIMDLWLQGNLDAHSFISRNYWLANVAEVRGAIKQSELYVATEHEDKIIGFIGLVNDYAAGLFVAANHRGHGIGSELLKVAIRTHPHLTLHVYEKNPRAFELYRRLGFKVISKQVDDETGEMGYSMEIQKGTP